MKKHLKSWIRACLICQRRKTPRPRAGLTQDISAAAPFDTVAIDHVGPLRETPQGNRYVLTVTCIFSRWPILIPVSNTSASVTAYALLTEVVCRHGVPRVLMSDRGSGFVGRVMQRLCARLGMQRRPTTAYQPQSNGRSERFHASRAHRFHGRLS